MQTFEQVFEKIKSGELYIKNDNANHINFFQNLISNQHMLINDYKYYRLKNNMLYGENNQHIEIGYISVTKLFELFLEVKLNIDDINILEL